MHSVVSKGLEKVDGNARRKKNGCEKRKLSRYENFGAVKKVQ